MASEANHVRTPEEHERLMAAIREDNERRIALSQTPVEMPEFAGRLIGNGGGRNAYQHIDNPAWIVKVAHNMLNASANIGEWYSGVLLVRLGMQDWVAPCIETAWDGTWLIMERTEPLTEPIEIDMPCILTWDTKLRNWGRLNGRIVCHDYANIGLRNLRELVSRTQKTQLYYG